MAANDPKRHRTPAEEDLGIVDGLVQLSFMVQAVLGRVATSYDASILQARLIGMLRDRELGMAQLARVLNLDKSSTTGLVDRAEGRGLVRRTTVPGDGRAVHVVLTSKGKKLANAFVAEVEVQLNVAVEVLSASERRRLSSLASRVVFHDAATQGLDLSSGLQDSAVSRASRGQRRSDAPSRREQPWT
jgi:DNA-binding MarR family transcriptional regulator